MRVRPNASCLQAGVAAVLCAAVPGSPLVTPGRAKKHEAGTAASSGLF
jgi:hypothetical protein